MVTGVSANSRDGGREKERRRGMEKERHPRIFKSHLAFPSLPTVRSPTTSLRGRLVVAF